MGPDPNVNLTEGALQFRLNGVDFAEKYDDWRHYRNVFNSACGSSKAVDELAPVSTGHLGITMEA